MPASWGIISDDLTGASAVAAMAVTRGASAWVGLGPRPRRRPPWHADLVVVDTASRDAARREAGRRAAQAARWLAAAGSDHLARRIDTTLRGHIGVEVAAILGALTAPHVAVVVPAAPSAGRTALGGRVLVGGRPLLEVAGLDGDVRRALADHTGIQVLHLPLAGVRNGPAFVSAAVKGVAGDPLRAILCDAATGEDIQRIAAGVARCGVPVLPVDPGPFTVALAEEQHRLSGAAWAPTDRPDVREAPLGVHASAGIRGRVLAVFGSTTATAARQVARAVRQGAVAVVNVDGALVAGRDPVALVEAVCAALRSGRTPAVGVRVPFVAPAADRPAIAATLAGVTERVLECGPVAGLYLSGGAVARAVLDRLGADGVDIDGEVLPLAAVGRLTGGSHAGLSVVTKGGLVGDEDAIVRCLQALA